MANRFRNLTFTDSVKQVQTEMGSRRAYAVAEAKAGTGELSNEPLTESEAEFLSERDTFYMSSVTETDWPYVQHRGGPKGFVKILSPDEIGFADYAGNRQYISVGNFRKNQRVALIFVDYPSKARLKILGTARVVDAQTEPALLEHLSMGGGDAKVERGLVIKVEGYDWNCPQHITPRWTKTEIDTVVQPLLEEIANLKQELAKLRAELRSST